MRVGDHDRYSSSLGSDTPEMYVRLDGWPCTLEAIHIQTRTGTKERVIQVHTDTDKATYYGTMSRLTGHSVRYLKVRTAVRLCVALLPMSTLFSFALTK